MSLDTFYRKVLLPPVRCFTANDAETAHEWFLSAMQFAEAHASVRAALSIRSPAPDPRLQQTLLDGLTFPTPFGIAAGFDKNAAIVHAIHALTSPGFIEIGTVTPRAQPGNPRPRIVRVDKDNMINAMGFPNEGIDAVLARLMTLRPLTIPLGLNIGKMKATSEADAASDYAGLIRATGPLLGDRQLPDYYVVNVSSPNTPGLTSLQKIEPLTEIMNAVVAELDALSTDALRLRHRLLIKLGADIEPADLESTIGLILELDLGGIITTNTTMTRPVSSRFDERPGGFSGSALYDRASAVVRRAAALLPRNKALVATGGIDSVDRAYEMLRYADLVGGYTGLVLQGPHLFRRLSKSVAARMGAAGVSTLAELRADHRPA